MRIIRSEVEKPTIWPNWYITVVGEDGTRCEGEASSEEAAEECRKRWEDDIRKTYLDK